MATHNLTKLHRHQLTAARACGLNGSMHHRGRVKIVIARGPPTPVEEWITACRVAPVEI
jgi:hypothetical protein